MGWRYLVVFYSSITFGKVQQIKKSWMVYSGKGASLMEIMSSPPANDTGSCYIQHVVKYYEPI